MSAMKDSANLIAMYSLARSATYVYKMFVKRILIIANKMEIAMKDSCVRLLENAYKNARKCNAPSILFAN